MSGILPNGSGAWVRWGIGLIFLAGVVVTTMQGVTKDVSEIQQWRLIHSVNSARYEEKMDSLIKAVERIEVRLKTHED